MAVTLKDIEALLENTGLPVAYRSFPENIVPPLPYICYLNPYDNNFSADGQVYMEIKHLQIELYTKMKEPNTEERVKKAISNFFWERTENYLDSEECYQIIFELEV